MSENVCCEKFAYALGHLVTPIGGGFLYPPTAEQSAGQIEPDEDGTYAVLGCCHHCYVLEGLKFCPFCGAKVAEDLEGGA